MTKHFIQIFFNLEHLIVEIELPEQIFELINQLIKLKSARFSYDSIDHPNDKNFIINRYEIVKQTRLCDHSFTFKNDEISRQISFWINPSTSNKKTQQTSINFYRRKTEIFVFF